MITLQFSAEEFRDAHNLAALFRAAGSTAIRLADTWGECSHVDTVLDNGQWYGARLNGGVKAREPYPVSLAIRMDVWVPDERAYFDFIFAQDGKPYDVTALAGFLVRRDWQRADRWFCSELKAAGLMKAAPTLQPVFDRPGRISPTALRRDVQSYNAGHQALAMAA